MENYSDLGCCSAHGLLRLHLCADTNTPPPRGGGATELDSRMEHAIDMMFRAMDTDHDGKISKSEWMAFQEKQFKMLDKNGDGFITKDEVRAKMREDQERRAMAPK